MTALKNKSDDSQADLLASFLRELKTCAKDFGWEYDGFRQIRGFHPECAERFCPITAVWFAKTGKAVRGSQVHDVAEAMGLGLVSTIIVDAVDEHRYSSPFYQRLEKIVGFAK